jgi:metal-dependent HD superfamily phosphatase/phosphodiesterase
MDTSILERTIYEYLEKKNFYKAFLAMYHLYKSRFNMPLNDYINKFHSQILQENALKISKRLRKMVVLAASISTKSGRSKISPC